MAGTHDNTADHGVSLEKWWRQTCSPPPPAVRFPRKDSGCHLPPVADAPISQPIIPTLLPSPQRILFLTHHDAAGCRDSLQHGGDARALLLVPSFSREIISDLYRRRLLLDPLHIFGCVKFYRTHQCGLWWWCLFGEGWRALQYAACGDYLEHGCGITLLPPASGGMIWDVPRGYMAPLQFLLHDAAGAGVPMRRQQQQGIFFLTHFNVAWGGGAYSGKGGEHDDRFRHDAADDFQLHGLYIPHCAGHDLDSIDWSGTLERVFHEPEAIADCEDWSHGFHRLFRQTRKRWRTVDAAVDWTDAFYLVFDVPVLRRSLRLASKPRVDYAGMC